MKSKNRGLWIGIGVVLALLVIGAGVVLFSTRKKVVPPDPAANREKAMAFIASEDFAKMPLAQQRAYAAKMRPPRGQRPPQNSANNGRRPRRPDENMTEAQRKLFRKNMHRVREAEMNERLNRFFAMSKEDQLAELDKSIAEHEKRRKNRPPRPPQAQQQTAAKTAAANQSSTATATGTQTANSAAQQDNRRRRPSAQDRREHDEEFSPATRAKMSAYFQLMRLRQQGKLK